MAASVYHLMHVVKIFFLEAYQTADMISIVIIVIGPVIIWNANDNYYIGNVQYRLEYKSNLANVVSEKDTQISNT